ncbi:MAG: tetratricopeptide repeat protein [Candidatus Heimdallarchaeota archaeon]
MPRFSQKAKRIFDLIFYNGDVYRARNLLKEITNPLDRAISRVWIAFYLLLFQQFTELQRELAELDEANKRLKDDFLQLIISLHYFAYFMGFNNPVVSRSQSEKYLKIAEKIIQKSPFEDNWEKFLAFGRFETIKAWNAELFQKNVLKAIHHQRKSIVAYSKVPQDGEYLSQAFHVNLGAVLQNNGQFDDAGEAHQKALTFLRKYGNIFQIWPLGSLMEIRYLQGDLIQAKNYAEKFLEVSKQHDNIYGISNALSWKGFFAVQEGSYENALKFYLDSLTYRKQYGVPLRTFFGHLDIFNFYLSRFKVSKDSQYLEEARDVLSDLKKISTANPDDPTITNYMKYAEALVYKYGTLRTKSQALDILEELVELYPDEIEISLNLMELLFEDLSLSGDQETIDQIDRLMLKVGQIPLRKNPRSIFSFISQQIIQAKYHYYLQGDVTRALDLLLNANRRLETYNLPHLMKTLDQEITDLEKERKKWESADLSLKERMKTSEFKQYLQEALLMASKDRSS